MHPVDLFVLYFGTMSEQVNSKMRTCLIITFHYAIAFYVETVNFRLIDFRKLARVVIVSL